MAGAPLLDYAELLLAALAIIGMAYGFYTGVLPRWIKAQVGFYDLKADVCAIKDDTETLKDDHRETMAQIDTLKHGQLALAEAVEDEHDSVHTDRLRAAHFGEGNHATDFLRGGD